MLKSLMSRLRWLVAAIALALPVLAPAQSADKPFTSQQLDQMLAQIALYPDSLLSQVLMAATYPDEFQEAYKWSKSHPDTKGDDAVKQVESNNWDPSVASMVAFPEVLITLGEKPDYVKNLGDAFLAQPDEVMDSVQRLRAGAQKAGNLKSNEQIKVSTEPAPPPTSTTVVVKEAPPVTQTIIIEPAQPSVVYVPAYNPTVVYGPWWYPAYPPYYYPPPPGYWFSRTVATGIAWGVGIGVSNALWGGFGWNNHDVNINVNRYNNINANKRLDVNSNRTNWTHNTEHRKTAYRGGDAQRQNLDRKTQAAGRADYRGKDASRDASRERAAQSMQARGVEAPSGSARERAQAADRGAAAQRAQSADRDAARQNAQRAAQDNAFKGAGDRQARQEVDRGAASAKAAERSGGAHAMPTSAGGGARAAGGGGGGARAGGGGGGGARAGGGGGGGGGRGGGGGGGGGRGR